MKRRRPRNAPPALPLPANTIVPAISGTAQVPNVLTCDGGSWTGSPTITFQWKRGGVNIAGATTSTYALAVADVGANITCAVSATNTTGASPDNPKVSNAIGPITAQPALNALTMTAQTIAEGSAAGTVVGTIGATTGGSTLSLADDAGGRFAISGSDIVATGTPTDYETATSHNITIRETLAGASNNPRDTVKAITVTNVLEAAALVALSISNDSIAENSADNTVVGTITGKQAGSVLTITDDSGGQFKLSGSVLLAAAVPTDYETESNPTVTIRETLADSPNSPRDTVIALIVTNVVEGGEVTPNAPVLTLTSNVGDVPPNWTASYTGIILGRTTIRLNWRIKPSGGVFGGWSSEDHLITSDDLINGQWDWPAFAATAFAEGADVEIREYQVLDAGVGETVSPASNVLSDHIEDITPTQFTFTDQVNVTVNTQVTSDLITILGVDAGLNLSASVDAGEYQKNGGAWTAAGAFTVQLNDTIKLRHTSSTLDDATTAQTLTVSGVTDTFTATTGAGVFNAGSVGNLQAWLDASQLTGALNDPISSWPDESGNGFAASLASGTAPKLLTASLNSKNVVDFGGSASAAQMNFASTLMQGKTQGSYIAVVKVDNDPPSTNPNSGAILSLFTNDTSASKASNWPFTDGIVYEHFGTTVRSTVGNPSPALSSYRIYYVEITAGGVHTVYLDGTQIFTAAGKTVNFGAVARALGWTGGSGYMDGKIAELAIYDAAHSAPNRQSLEGYLAHKWFGAGASNNLPSGHPYKSVAP